jgi:hypothetical protein
MQEERLLAVANSTEFFHAGRELHCALRALSRFIVCLTMIFAIAGVAQAVTCTAVNSPLIANLPDRLNVQSADVSVNGSVLTVTLFLKQVPSPIVINAPANALNAMEYWW